MRKFVSIVAAAALAASFNVGAITTAAAEDGRSDTVEICKFLIEIGFPFTVGECVSSANKAPVEFCKEYYEVVGFKNQGECVSTIRHIQNL